MAGACRPARPGAGLRTPSLPDPDPDGGGPGGHPVRAAFLAGPLGGRRPSLGLLDAVGDGGSRAGAGCGTPGFTGRGRRWHGRGAAPGRWRPGAQDRMRRRRGADPGPGLRAVPRGRRDRGSSQLRSANAAVGRANARLLERSGPAGPSGGRGRGARIGRL